MDEATKRTDEQDVQSDAAQQPCCGCAQTNDAAPCCAQSEGCGGCCAALDAAQAAAEPASNGDAPQAAKKVTVVDIRFRNNAKNYFFDPGELTIATGDHVIMDTSRGVEYGVCAAGNHEVPASEIVPPLRKVLRLATPQDEHVNAANLEKEKRAFDVCLQKIAEHKLEMQLVSAECAFDGSKLLFFFTADGRVDFRELVKDLASVFRTRIELRQIGVRDKAKMVGGLGVCGRPFCCREFLDDFQPVSIKMAKTQNLSLNPTKISGVCGRLMCCLKYEQDAYEDLLRTAPKNESFVDTPDGRGTITDVNLLRQSVKVRMEDHPETIGTYKNCDICVLRSGKARKNDPPIPKDLAPISSRPRPAVKPVEEVIYPDDVAFADPVPTPQAESADPAPVTDEEKAASKNHRRRRGRGGRGNGKPAAEAQAEGAAKAPQEPRPAQDRPKQQNPNRPKQERKPQKPQEPREPKEPREPREPRPALQDQSEKSAGEGGNPNRRRRRYHGKRGGGAPKAEG